MLGDAIPNSRREQVSSGVCCWDANMNRTPSGEGPDWPQGLRLFQARIGCRFSPFPMEVWQPEEGARNLLWRAPTHFILLPSNSGDVSRSPEVRRNRLPYVDLNPARYCDWHRLQYCCDSIDRLA